MVQEPMLRFFASKLLPDYKFSQLRRILLGLNSKQEFQERIMVPLVEGISAKTKTELTLSGLENINPDVPNVFITNHRDIVLDSAQLSYLLLKNGFDTCEIAIGNNLLIYDWINKLVRLNKCFIVKRNLGRMQTLTAAIELSRYIHFVILEKKNPVWIAQREGRCKDSNDRTQESLVKMLTYGNREKPFLESLKELNLAPIAISYEYDPNDYLKAYELLNKSKNPNHKKTPDDDLLSMRTGILGFKGEVHYAITPCLNEEFDHIPADLDKFLTVRRVCNIIDHAIHSNYKIFKTNYMAHDLLFDDKQFVDRYTPEELDEFKNYLSNQINKIESNLNEFDRFYMYSKMLQIYSNPLTNYLEAMQ